MTEVYYLDRCPECQWGPVRVVKNGEFYVYLHKAGENWVQPHTNTNDPWLCASFPGELYMH